MNALSDCRVGIESIAVVFEEMFKTHNSCIHIKDAFDSTSEAFKAYNSTVCALAEECHKAAYVGESFFACIKEAFCQNATDAVKAMGKIIFEIDRQNRVSAAETFFPVAAGVAVVSLGAAVIVDRCATQNKVTKAFSSVATAVGACSMGLAGYYYNVINRASV